MEEEQINKVYSIDELNIQQGAFVCICSKRCSGKSILTKNLIKDLLDKNDYDIIIMFSETSQFNKDYDFLDQSLIFKTTEMENKIEKILKLQEKNIKKNKKVNILIIADDVLLHHKSKQLINLSSLGRHYNITCIISLQYCKGLCNSSIRQNIDYFFISDLGDTALKSIYESIHINLSYKEFKNFVNQNNHNYQFIMYDSRTQNKNEKIKVCKAKIFNSLKMINK